MEYFAKRIMRECRYTTRGFFGAGKVSWNYITLINILSKAQETKGL